MTLWTGVALAVTALALSATPQVDAEIDQLLAALRGSDCRFQRNGTWYDAHQAAQHLGTKRAYFGRLDRIRSTEDFIRLAATGSSLSGKAYSVACPGKPEIPSSAWLEAELVRIRARPPEPRPPRS
jgi:hypothetical protein